MDVDGETMVLLDIFCVNNTGNVEVGYGAAVEQMGLDIPVDDVWFSIFSDCKRG